MPNPAAKSALTRKKAVRHKKPKVDVELMFERLAASRPEPKTELNYINPFTLVVAVALSAQATDVGVNRPASRCSPPPIPP